MIYENLQETIGQEVADYLLENSSQEAIQAARSAVKDHRLGRQPRTAWEYQQVLSVKVADTLLKAALSDTLDTNRKARGAWRRG